MPNRIIKESILTSPTMNKLSVYAERHFYRLLLLVDDYGCFESHSMIIRGKCYPLNNVSVSQIKRWQDELIRNNIIRTWMDNEREYSIFVKFDEHNSKYCVTDKGKNTRHRRRTPEPPLAILSQDSPNPNPNPKHNHNPNHNQNPKHNPSFKGTLKGVAVESSMESAGKFKGNAFSKDLNGELIEEIEKLTGDNKSSGFWIEAIRQLGEERVRSEMGHMKYQQRLKKIDNPAAYLTKLLRGVIRNEL